MVANDCDHMLVQDANNFLDILSDKFRGEELERVAHTLGVAVEQVKSWQEDANNKRVDHEQAHFEIALIGAQMNAMIQHRGTPSTVAILQASVPELEEWRQMYREDALTAHQRLCKSLERSSFSPQALADFQRLAGYLWEVEKRMGLL